MFSVEEFCLVLVFCVCSNLDFCLCLNYELVRLLCVSVYVRIQNCVRVLSVYLGFRNLNYVRFWYVCVCLRFNVWFSTGLCECMCVP